MTTYEKWRTKFNEGGNESFEEFICNELDNMVAAGQIDPEGLAVLIHMAKGIEAMEANEPVTIDPDAMPPALDRYDMMSDPDAVPPTDPNAGSPQNT